MGRVVSVLAAAHAQPHADVSRSRDVLIWMVIAAITRSIATQRTSKTSAGRRVVSVLVAARAQPHADVSHSRDARIWMVIAAITRNIATQTTSKRSAGRRVVSAADFIRA